MRNDNENKLWEDMLSDVAPAEFRKALLNQTLGRVRRRKRMRRLGQGVMVGALVMVAGLLLWPGERRQTVQQPKPVLSNVEVVSSQPLDSSMVVQSVPGLVELVNSKPAELILVDTRREEIRRISDEELLALVGNRPAALVRKGPNEAELLIVDASSRDLITAGAQETKQ
jgi:hypothetical protein